MKWILFLSGLLLSNIFYGQEYVENQPAEDKGSFYTGYLKDGKYHGEGTYYYSFKRAYYKGPWKNGLKHGKGTLVQFSGNTYRATWVDDQIIGEAVYEFVHEGDVLYRTMVDGNFTDAYKLVYHNGTVLEGTTIAGDLEGMVTYTFKDGTKQEVEFKKDKPATGDGFVKDNFAYLKKYKEGYYTGDWHNEAPHGKGGFSGSVVYRGEWVNGIKEGEGYIYYSNNNTYRGHFENGLRNGKGIMRYQADKSYAEGNFIKNLLNGPGTYTIASGTSFSGNFIGSDFDGEVIGTDTEGNISYYTYKDGKQVKDTSTEVVAKAEVKTATEPKKEEVIAAKSEFPAKLEGEDLMHFLFNTYDDRKVTYWLDKHPDELFKELDWKFTMPGIAVAYSTGNYGKDAQKQDKPYYYRKASYVEVSEGFEGKLPGDMDYDAFVNAIVQEDYNLLNTYYSQVTSKRYELEYSSNTDIWDDFVMSLKNGQGSLWVHGIKGFPSSFKVRFISGKIDISSSAHQSEKKWLSDRSTRGGDCTTCQLENQGKKRIFTSAEIEYMAAVSNAKVDLNVYKNHPQLKYLGSSIYNPDMAALIQKNADAGDKSIFISLDFSRYKWEDELESEVRGRPNKKGYWYILDEVSGSIAGVLFIRKEDKFWKWRAYKGSIPQPEKWMEVLKFKGLDTYRISPDKEEETFQKNLETHLDRLIKAQIGTGALVQSREDLERFSKPKGEDIWKVIGAKPDKVLNTYLFANQWAFDESYNYGINGYGDNEYYIDGNNKHIIRTLRNVGYEYLIKGSSDNDFAQGNVPIDIRVEFDLNILLPQLWNLPEFSEAVFKERTEKVFNRDVEKKVIQITLNTSFGNRYMVINKYEDQEGGRFSGITFKGESMFTYDAEKLTQENNPWKTHNETLIAVSRADERVYLNAFEKLFAQMETGFESVAEKGVNFINNEVKRVYLNSSIKFPKSTIGFATITQYKDTDLNWYKAKMTEDVKNEYINVLLLRKYAGDYRIIGSETDSESTFGKTLIIEKNQKVVGSVRFERHKDDGNSWWMEVQTFSEERFQESLLKVLTQATKDDYNAWKAERANEKGVYSSYNFYNARASFIIDPQEENEKTGFSSAFENTPAYLIDYTLSKWKKGSNIRKNLTVIENFRRYGAMTRAVTLNNSGTDLMIVFEPTSESLNRIQVSHGEDFSTVTEEAFTPANLSKTTALAMKSMEGQGNDLVWSSDYDWQFFFKFDNYFTQNNIPGQYMVLLVYESSRIEPPYASVSGRVDGEFMSLKTTPERAIDLGDNFKVNAMSFILDSTQSSFTLGGSYGFKDDGLIVKALLYRIK